MATSDAAAASSMLGRSPQATSLRARLILLLAVAVVTIVAVAIGVKMAGLRVDLRLLSVNARLLPSVLLGTASIASFGLVMVLRRGGWPIVGAAILATVGAAIAREGFVSVSVVMHLQCFAWGLAVALLPLSVALVGARVAGDRALLCSPVAGATLGAAAGLAAASMLHLHCSLIDVAHATVVHGGLVAALAAVGALAAPRLAPARSVV